MSGRSESGEQGMRLAPALVPALVPALGPVLLLAAGISVAQPAAAQGVPLVIEDMPLAQNAAVKRGGTVTPAVVFIQENGFASIFNRPTRVGSPCLAPSVKIVCASLSCPDTLDFEDLVSDTGRDPGGYFILKSK